jgi:hypothetical protein
VKERIPLREEGVGKKERERKRGPEITSFAVGISTGLERDTWAIMTYPKVDGFWTLTGGARQEKERV